MGKKFPFQTGYEPQRIFERDGVMWSTVPGSVGYLVSEYGDVIGRRGKPMAGGLDTKGYPKVLMYNIDDKLKSKKRHRLVAELFIPNPKRNPQVNHIDADKENNHISNLEWVTNSENHAHKMGLGLNVTQRGEAHGMALLTEEDAVAIYLDGRLRKVIAEDYCISKASVDSIKGGRNWNYVTKGLRKIG